MMKRKLYPVSSVDRINFWLGIINAILAVGLAILGSMWMALFNGMLSALMFIIAYVFQDKPPGEDSRRYSRVIEQISQIAKQLSDLSGFLEVERERVSEAENTLYRLQDEKNKLEPVVSAQKETVDAILIAHAARTATAAWKERIIGFALGVLASLIAALVFNFLNM